LRAMTQSPPYITTSDSDEGLSAHQDGARKRRKLSPALPPSKPLGSPSISRVKAKQSGLVAKPSEHGDDATFAVRSGTETITFAALDVAPWLSSSLAAMEIKRPTGIQKSCIPEILKGRDCIGGSRTGTGKTVAFAVPILQKWAEDPMGIYAVVITPTRCVLAQAAWRGVS
jgi:ATP-dependent RNA helicase DDX49/DBP8